METSILIVLVGASINFAVSIGNIIYLIRKRRNTLDHSRRILAFAVGIGVFISLFNIVQILYRPTGRDLFELMPPESVFSALLAQTLLLLYPAAAVRPPKNAPVYFGALLAPWVLLILLFLPFIIKGWTILLSWDDLLQNRNCPDVLLRLTALFFLISYGLFLLPWSYNLKQANARPRGINLYSLGVFGFGLLMGAAVLTGSALLRTLSNIWIAAFFYVVVQYESERRPLPQSQRAGDDTPPRKSTPDAAVPISEDIWANLCKLMDEDEIWRDPDLTLKRLAQLCTTNTTYLSNTLKEHGETGFVDFVNKRRIDYVTSAIKQNPDADLKTLFQEAGYRSRSTAWRNFKEATGVSPSEYRDLFHKNNTDDQP